MAGSRRYRDVHDEILKWIIIDDKSNDLKLLAEEVKKQGVESENIIGFKVESQGKFEAPAKDVKGISGLLNSAEVSETPTFDYLGYTYSFDSSNEWEKFESEDPIKLYEDVLYSEAKEVGKAINFIVLIDLDFGNNSFCGFDILTLLRKTLKPTNYQVRFITNVPRKSIKKFIDEEYGDNFAILGDNNHLSFISKDSAFRQLPIITKDYYNQFTSTFIEQDQKSIYDVYKKRRKDKVVCLSDKEIKITIGGREYQEIIRIKNLDELENEINNKNYPTIVVIDLDSYESQIRRCIRDIERISMMIPKYEVQGFSVYFVASNANKGSLRLLSNSRWKTFLHILKENSENKNLELEVKVTDVSSSLYWKFRVLIDSYRQYIHDLKHALESEDKIKKINEIKEEIEASLKFSYDTKLDDLFEKLNENESVENLSIDDIEKPLEKILWIVVGIDKDSVNAIVKKLNEEAKDLKGKYLNEGDEFIGLNLASNNHSILDQIKGLDKIKDKSIVLNEYENIIFLFDNVMPCYDITRKDFTKAFEKIKKEFEKGEEGKFKKAIKIISDGFSESSEFYKNYYNNTLKFLREEFTITKITKTEFEKAKNPSDFIKEVFENNYFTKAYGSIYNYFEENNKGGNKGLDYFNKIKENLKKAYLDVAFDFIKEEYEKKEFAKALEIIKNEFVGKNFTCRILERKTWTFVEGEGDLEWKQTKFINNPKEEKKKYDIVKKTYKSGNKCLDFLVYSCPDGQPIFTVDRLFFMREDLKKSHSYARNPAFNELMSELRDSDSVPYSYTTLTDVLKNKSAKWQIIEWKSNNGCDEKYNEAILINRLCILDFFYSDQSTNCVMLYRLEQFIKDKNGKKGNLSWWNFLHQQYAFNTHQETKSLGKRNIITILFDSLFEYEKNYLDEKFNNK